jgi:rSAM/selenodomain-associated transferase 1
MRVLLFTKFPQPGMVKTRLAGTVGAENAAKLQQAFIEDELHMLTSIGAHTTLYCDPFRPLSDYERLFGPGFTYRTQQGRDIGERMLSALHQTLAETGEPVVLMGSDLPDLPDLRLGEAFAALRTAQVCLGPATDGGFYLLGLRVPLPDGIFDGVAWGGSGVLSRTLDNCASAGLTCLLLPPWPDVDTAADLADYVARNRNKKTRSMDTIRALGLMGEKWKP